MRKHFHVHLVVRQQDEALEMVGLGRGVVFEALDRQIYALRAKQEELLPRQVEGTLVDLLEQLRRT